MSQFQQFVESARNFACGIYRNSPGALIPNPLDDPIVAVWDELCGTNPSPSAPPLPAPPAPPFTGGQCVCVLYDVNCTFFQGTPAVNGYIVAQTAVRIYGKIKGTFSEQNNPDNFELGFYCQGDTTMPCQTFPYRLKTNNSGFTRDGLKPFLRIDSITRVGGGADNCGNPPASFPPAPPPPTGGYKSPPVPITNNDNTITNYYFNFKPPTITVKPALTLPPVIVNVFRPEISPTLNVPISFNFDGTIEFGGGGDSTFNEGDRNTINNISSSTTELADQVTNIQNDITNITNNYNNAPINPDDYEPPGTPLPPGEREQDYLAAVAITLTQIPLNAKTQSGDGAPNVIYAGWFEWRRAGFYTVREPIHFENSLFLAPEGIDGYAWTLYNGFQGTAQEIINKEKT